MQEATVCTWHFNPRPPWGGRLKFVTVRGRNIYFNPRPPWGGRLVNYLLDTDTDGISIHALRGEGDGVDRIEDAGSNISIHALRGEGDDKAELINKINKHFNPRPPWGGRLLTLKLINNILYFNPRPPWGGRPRCSCHLHVNSIFQSTPSVGRATY